MTSSRTTCCRYWPACWPIRRTARGLDSWLEAKARVVAALRPLTPEDTVRGQYEGYHDVAGVAADSTVESYVAVRLACDSWRWAGVPLLIRAGKTMPVTATEIDIRFRPVAVRRLRGRADASQQPAAVPHLARECRWA